MEMLINVAHGRSHKQVLWSWKYRFRKGWGVIVWKALLCVLSLLWAYRFLYVAGSHMVTIWMWCSNFVSYFFLGRGLRRRKKDGWSGFLGRQVSLAKPRSWKDLASLSAVVSVRNSWFGVSLHALLPQRILVCFVVFSQSTAATLFNIINCLICVMDTHCSLCSRNWVFKKFRLQRVNWNVTFCSCFQLEELGTVWIYIYCHIRAVLSSSHIIEDSSLTFWRLNDEILMLFTNETETRRLSDKQYCTQCVMCV